MPRFTIDVGGELDKQLSTIAASDEVTKAEIIRRAIAAYTVFKREQAKRTDAEIVIQANGETLVKIAVI